MNMDCSALVVAWEEGVESRDTLLVCKLNPSKSRRVNNGSVIALAVIWRPVVGPDTAIDTL